MASVALVLSSLIGAWLGSESRTVFTSSLVYGDTSSSIISIKYVALLICFLTAFGAFVQTARCFVHANFLISMPNSDIPVTCSKGSHKGKQFLGAWNESILFCHHSLALGFWSHSHVCFFPVHGGTLANSR